MALLPRLSIFATNSLIGVITFIPNVMLSDSGTEKAILASQCGVLSSATFVSAGVAGLLPIPPGVTIGLTGAAVCLQIAAFAVFGFR